MNRIGERRFRANLTIFEPSTASIEDRNRDRSRTERNDDHVVLTTGHTECDGFGTKGPMNKRIKCQRDSVATYKRANASY